jgi:hypothetical protein
MHGTKSLDRPSPMKKIIRTVCCTLVVTLSAFAANYTVNSNGSGDFSSIQSCANAMSPGDTCTVYAGTYNESVTVPAGTAGNYKTVTVNSGDTVTVKAPVTLNSYTKFNGFNISGSGNCISIGSVTQVTVSNNTTMTCTGIHSSGTYIYIIGNTVRYPGSPNNCTPSVNCDSREGIFLSGGDHVLIDGNNLSHFDDGIVNKASYVIVRNQVQHDSLTTECGADSSNCHIDEIETWGPSTTVVYENNIFHDNSGANAHGGYFQYTGGQQAITRFNTLYNIQSMSWFDDYQDYSHVKHYNETKVDAGTSPGATDYWTSSTNGSEINDIFVYTAASSLPGGFAPYTQSASSPFTSGCNLAYRTTGSYSWAGPITSDGSQLGVDPQFANLSSHDYHLQAGSPARNAGCPLTAASGTGSSSTSLAVADASFFQDGYGISGVQPDTLRIGTSTTVQIAPRGVNYSNNVITLASPVSWNRGDPIYLYKDSSGKVVLNGTKPDLGAIPYDTGGTSAVAPPSGLSAVVQ